MRASFSRLARDRSEIENGMLFFDFWSKNVGATVFIVRSCVVRPLLPRNANPETDG